MGLLRKSNRFKSRFIFKAEIDMGRKSNQFIYRFISKQNFWMHKLI